MQGAPTLRGGGPPTIGERCMGVCKRARFGHRFERLRQQQEKAWWIKRRIHRRKHRPPAPFGRASLRSDFETHGRCKRSLAAIEGHELFDSHQFRCRNMDNVQTPRTVDRGMFFAEARRQAQNGRPFDCRSDQSSAMQVFLDIFPRGCRLSIRQQLTKDSELKCISYF